MPMSTAAKYELKNPVTERAAELNVMSGTLVPDVLDISHLTRDMGVFTYDPSFMEMVSDPHMRIGRPRQLYTGPARRDYRALEERPA